MSKETKVDKAIIDLNAIDRLSALNEPRNELLTGLLHCKAKQYLASKDIPVRI